MDSKKIIGLSLLGVTVIALLNRKTSKSIKTRKMAPTEFFQTYYPIALQDQQLTGVPALFTISQAAIESEYGLKAFGNNFFGIKANSSWTGPTMLLKTWEAGRTGNPKKDNISDSIIAIYPPGDKNGIFKTMYSYRVNSKFRKYATPLEGFTDHSKFLRENNRYKTAFNYIDDPKQFAKQIALAGYATDPNYFNKISNTIDHARTLTA